MYERRNVRVLVVLLVRAVLVMSEPLREDLQVFLERVRVELLWFDLLLLVVQHPPLEVGRCACGGHVSEQRVEIGDARVRSRGFGVAAAAGGQQEYVRNEHGQVIRVMSLCLLTQGWEGEDFK